MNSNLIERARDGFRSQFGDEPEGVVFAPGRVNLIGEHVDYCDGLVLPMPITAGTAIAWMPLPEGQVDAVALDLDGSRDGFVLQETSPHEPVDWRSYLRGMAAEMAVRGLPTGGARLAIAGDIPRGSGLSSSASLCIAVGRALTAAGGGKEASPRALALAAQQAEHRWAGVRCGIMDQMAAAAGLAGSALLLDCRSLDTAHVRLPADWAVMIVQSGVRRGLVDGHYNARRADCETAVAHLGVPSLREADPALVEAAALDPVVRRRARHVVADIARTRSAVEAIRHGNLRELGCLLRASHASLRDDFEVSVPAVDRLVDCLNAAIGEQGGARMTGGGFGGAVVAVLPADAVARVSDAVRSGYAAPDGEPLQIVTELAGNSPAGVD